LLGSDQSTENQRQVSEYEVREFVDAHAPFVKHCEASMKNCYGLKNVKIFLDLPFLKQQRDVIQAKLNRNIEDSQRAEEELRLTTEAQDYSAYEGKTEIQKIKIKFKFEFSIFLTIEHFYTISPSITTLNHDIK